MNSTASHVTPKPAPLTVLYDGACPLCCREIGLYRCVQPRSPESAVHFADVNDPALKIPMGVTRERLLARFHVCMPNGELLSGARAFLALWAVLPGWRWLALLGRVPGVPGLMEFGYRVFLRARPMLQYFVRRLDPARPPLPKPVDNVPR